MISVESAADSSSRRAKVSPLVTLLRPHPETHSVLVWRMVVAKGLVRRKDLGLAEVAERVGYGSASAFTTAFSRYAGQSPSRYARQHAGGA
jgi:AraC-like DNA-binding protein